MPVADAPLAPPFACVGSVISGSGGASTRGAGGGGAGRGTCRSTERPSSSLSSSSLSIGLPLGAFWGNLIVGDGRCLSSVPTCLSVAAATCFCSVFAIAAHPAHANEQSQILVDFRSSFVCLGCSFLLLAARWWRVLGEFGRWRWKVLVECAHAPICCGCYVFLFMFRNHRALSPCQRAVPNPGRFSIAVSVSVSRVLFSSSGGALVARFWGNLVVGDGRCLSCVPARACLLWLLRVAVFRNCRLICPCQ